MSFGVSWLTLVLPFLAIVGGLLWLLSEGFVRLPA